MRTMVLVVLVACGGSAAPSIDASIEASMDASTPDASVDAPTASRMAIVGPCAMIAGPIGHTAEVTDTTGYVPTATATLQVGEVARFAYVDGGTEHTIVSGPQGAADGLFASAPFSDHGEFTCIRFDAPGSYPIHCDRHPAGLEHGTFTVVP